MIITMTVETMTSLRLGQVIFLASSRTSWTNSTGLVLAMAAFLG
jgi:hypothetical protein